MGKADKDICVQEKQKTKKTRSRGNFQSREELLKSVSAYESNIASLMNQIDSLKSEIELKSETKIVTADKAETASLADQITEKSKIASAESTKKKKKKKKKGREKKKKKKKKKKKS